MGKYLDNNGLLYFWQKIKNNFVAATSLATVATSGSYNDLDNKPTLFSGDYTDLTNKPTIPTVPTDNASFTNGAGYQTASDVQAAINTALSGITGISFEVVESLPTTGTAGTIYLVSNGSSSGTNLYNEWIYINNGWEFIGNTAVDLSNYLTTSDVVAITNAEIDTVMASTAV